MVHTVEGAAAKDTGNDKDAVAISVKLPLFKTRSESAAKVMVCEVPVIVISRVIEIGWNAPAVVGLAVAVMLQVPDLKTTMSVPPVMVQTSDVEVV